MENSPTGLISGPSLHRVSMEDLPPPHLSFLISPSDAVFSSLSPSLTPLISHGNIKSPVPCFFNLILMSLRFLW